MECQAADYIPIVSKKFFQATNKLDFICGRDVRNVCHVMFKNLGHLWWAWWELKKSL